MTTASIPQTTVKKNNSAAQFEPTREFTYGEWQAFKNGMLCSLMGYTGRELTAAEQQWSKPHRWAWRVGLNVTSTMTNRADVSYALYQRFGGEE